MRGIANLGSTRSRPLAYRGAPDAASARPTDPPCRWRPMTQAIFDFSGATTALGNEAASAVGLTPD